eukprot:364337-Chlamydomonas_euryale.AAC.5
MHSATSRRESTTMLRLQSVTSEFSSSMEYKLRISCMLTGSERLLAARGTADGGLRASLCPPSSPRANRRFHQPPSRSLAIGGAAPGALNNQGLQARFAEN